MTSLTALVRDWRKRALYFKVVNLILITVFPLVASATAVFDTHQNVRALGMGNAFTSVVSDSDALFFNPAGLAKVTGYYWRIFDVKGGLSGLDAVDKLANLQSSSGFASAVSELYGENMYLHAGGQTSITTPFVSASLFMNGSASIYAENPASPVMNLNYILDTGVAAGFGFHVLPFFQMGFALKSFTRAGVSKGYGLADLGALDPAVFEADLTNAGAGIALDMGMNIALDSLISPTLSFVWKNIGVTTIVPSSSATEAPPSDPEEMIIGASIVIDTPIVTLTPAFDFRYLNRTDMQLPKKINFGLEIDFPIVTLRGGYSQGYYTAGASLGLGLLTIDAATWGVELGEAPGQLEDRRYMLQIILELGFDPGFGSGSGKSGSRGGSRGSRGLKRRR